MEQRGRPTREGDLETASSGQVWAACGTPERGVVDASPERVAAHLERRDGEPAAEWLWLHLDAVAAGVSRRVRTIKWLPEEAEDTLLRPNKDLHISFDDGVLHGTLPGLERGA
ncbi:MAG: hypothetical protein INR65_07795, partial [Gluconacetobacter diazotrophicus]|nr:hypothetical protein [Gluconacetobacter diazotrophicus]